ncbi:MAG: response regulator [Anaerolineae bacterium]|jgi:two-component system sensor histidine kinase/response regulator
MANTDQKTILIIEDSTTQALHLQLLLEGNRLNVEWADTGLKGVEMAQQIQPDLIILDLQLPDINGVQVGQRLKSNPDTALIPIILMTRYDDSELVLEAMQIGIDDYIPKDAFADAVLVETLRQMGLIASGGL